MTAPRKITLKPKKPVVKNGARDCPSKVSNRENRPEGKVLAYNKTMAEENQHLREQLASVEGMCFQCVQQITDHKS
jgi:hypothetical protein